MGGPRRDLRAVASREVTGFTIREARDGDGAGHVVQDRGPHVGVDHGAAGSAHWRVVSEPGRLTVARGTGPVGCDVTGPAADLYLLLWNRRDEGGLDVRGDAELLARFREHSRVTWR